MMASRSEPALISELMTYAMKVCSSVATYSSLIVHEGPFEVLHIVGLHKFIEFTLIEVLDELARRRKRVAAQPLGSLFKQVGELVVVYVGQDVVKFGQ